MNAAPPPSDSILDDETVGDDRFDGGDLCPACLAELTAGCGFCPSCAAPVVPTAAIAPFERIFAEGYIYRQAVASPRSAIIVVGAWLIFLPLCLMGAAMVVWDMFFEKVDFLYRLEGICLLLLGGAGLSQVTRNYLRQRRQPVPLPVE